jgi:hypothetical protein
MDGTTLRHLNDVSLAEALRRLAAEHRRGTVSLILHLAEFDARRLHLQAGYPSLFAYCTAALRLSEYEAYLRIEAARDVGRFPILAEQLESGSLTLTTLHLLSPHLTEGNLRDLVTSAHGRSKREVAQILARRFPKPDVSDRVRKLPVRVVIAPAMHARATGEAGSGPEPSIPPLRDTRPPVVAPLSADRYEIRFTAPAATRAKLQRAQDLLRHAVPSGDLAEVFDRALTLLVADLERRRSAASERPRPARPTNPHSRHVPAEVRRVVWRRDDGRCAFVSAEGRRCSAMGFLELHHVRPYAAGGGATAATIQLRCRAHNQYEAEVYFRPIRKARTEISLAEVPPPGLPSGSGP